MTHKSTVHCQNDCWACPHYPNSEWCTLNVEGGRWEHIEGTIYWRIGECIRCGTCCGSCGLLHTHDDGLAECTIYSERLPGCRDFPTINKLFQFNSVPGGCGFGVMAYYSDGKQKRVR